MGDLSTIALIAVGVLLVVVSGVTVLLTRQVALVTKWVEERSASEGLEIGAEVPERALLLAPALASGLNYLAILDGRSQQGLEFALEAGREERLAGLRGRSGVTVAVLGAGEQADRAASLLPDWFELVRGSAADALRHNFKVRQTPAVYEIEGARVTGKAGSGYGVNNFVNLIAARSHSDAGEFAGGTERR